MRRYGQEAMSGFGFQLRYENDPGDALRIHTMFTPDPDLHHGVPGFLHGGAAATLLDQTMAALGWMIDRQRCVTGMLDLRYRRLVALDGQPVHITAWRLDPTPRRAQRVHGTLSDADGQVCVAAQALFVRPPVAAVPMAVESV